MNSGVKRKWVAALRSGAYKQRTGMLYDGKCHCALGVLLEISEMGVWVKHHDIYSYFTQDPHKDGNSLVFNRFAGMLNNETSAIVIANDVKQLSFNKIADIIEETM
jgi:hypothetical protein